MNNLKLRLFSCLWLAVGLLLAACGSEATPPPSNSPATTNATTTVATATTNSATTSATATAANLPTVTLAPATTVPVKTTATTTTQAVTTAPATTIATTQAVTTTAPSTQAATTAPTVSQTAADSIVTTFVSGDQLYASEIGATKPTKIADKVEKALYLGNGRFAVLQVVGTGTNGTLRLKLMTLNAGKVQETSLDPQPIARVTGTSAGGYYEFDVESRAIAFNSLAVSPDGQSLAYVKGNLNVKAFEEIHFTSRPTELWLADLNPANPNPRRLVANDKSEFVFGPVWSPDGERIAFRRTDNFGTGAGYPVAVWSVHSDGSRAAYLTGPKLGDINGQPYRAAVITQLIWTSPVKLSFQSYWSDGAIWLHDLSLGSDFPRPLANGVAVYSQYCPTIRRYAYVKTANNQGGTQDGYSVSVDQNAAERTIPEGVQFDPNAKQIYECQADTLLYGNTQDQTYLLRLKSDGSPAAGKVKLGGPVKSDNALHLTLSPDGRFAGGYDETNTSLTIYDSAGQLVVTQRLNVPMQVVGWGTNGTLLAASDKLSNGQYRLYGLQAAAGAGLQTLAEMPDTIRALPENF